MRDPVRKAAAVTARAEASFGQDIRPLFREMDVAEMAFLIDLTSHEEVREQAEAIYERLAAGTMPCDGDWPAERVELFRRWMDGGARP